MIAPSLGDKQAQLDQIKADMIKQNICPNLAKTATNMVFGDGSPNAEIVFIGEAPGKNEDLTGLPFVGAAGKFLNELLEHIGLRREDVYITSIIKYRPPQNRDPLPEEKAASWPYMQAQLEVINPKLVATLGRHSMNCFLPDLQISKVHGEFQKVTLPSVLKPGTTVEFAILPLFHPAAAIYNRGLRQTLMDDFSGIPGALKQITK
ncbi:MAG TPA: uracil-DNA glycosylase [Candidatus Saccharimonadales bacterium]|nr:uracil-DNA glycosylase [Candidatus Saccharimonadales bacterium]